MAEYDEPLWDEVLWGEVETEVSTGDLGVMKTTLRVSRNPALSLTAENAPTVRFTSEQPIACRLRLL